MITLTSVEHLILRTGQMFTFAKGVLPEEINTPFELIDRTVIIDGTVYVVNKVEHWPGLCAEPGQRCEHGFGLVVAE